MAEHGESTYIKDAMAAFDHIVGAFPITLGKAMSKRERNEKRLSKDNNLVYGEITLEAFGLVFQKIKELYGKPGIIIHLSLVMYVD